MEDRTHNDEMHARTERRLARRARSAALAPRPKRRPKPTTTNVEKVKAAKIKRDRKTWRRITEMANGAWR